MRCCSGTPNGADPSPLAAFEIVGNARTCFSPDGRHLITVSSSRGRAQQGRTPNEIHLWDVKKREKIATLRGYDADVVHLAFSPDGAQLASGGREGKVKLRDVKMGTEKAALHSFGPWIMDVAFRADGRVLVTGDYDGRIKLWDVKQEKELLTLWGHSWPLAFVGFIPEGNRLVSGTDPAVKVDLLDSVDPLDRPDCPDGPRCPLFHGSRGFCSLRSLLRLRFQ
ncbi:MAG: WD40 repeat domain-containing protein [Candidatus Brocadiia bacterium]